MSKAYRPSHADATYDMKYGVRAIQVMSFGIEMCCTASPDPSPILPLFKITTGFMGSMHGPHRSNGNFEKWEDGRRTREEKEAFSFCILEVQILLVKIYISSFYN